VPYNGDPDRVTPVPTAQPALTMLRSHGIAVGVITNQSGVGRGLVSPDQVADVNARLQELLGPFDVVEVCPHAPDAGCACRKPNPGMVLRACDRLDVPPHRCVVVGDIRADVVAAERAGATGVLVPNAATAAEDIDATSRTAASLTVAVRAFLVPG
jgi:HAD superfamily hydrolase (TIGR01662 family)